MKFKIIRLLLLLIAMAAFVIPIMHQRGQVDLKLNGIEAIVYGNYYVIGNIVLALVFSGLLLHLLSTILEIMDPVMMKKLESLINIIVNVTVLFSFIIITFLATFLELAGYMLIALIVLTTYLRYLDQKHEVT